MRVSSYPPLEGEGRLASCEAGCETGWGDSPSARHFASERLSPHPAARCTRVDPPPPGEGEGDAHRQAQRGHGAGIPVKSIHTICFYRMQTGGHAHAQSADFLRRRPPIARGPSLTMRHKRAPRMGARRRKPGAGGCSYRIWPCRLTVLAGPAKVSHNHRRRDDRETAEPHDRSQISGARHAR